MHQLINVCNTFISQACNTQGQGGISNPSEVNGNLSEVNDNLVAILDLINSSILTPPQNLAIPESEANATPTMNTSKSESPVIPEHEVVANHELTEAIVPTAVPQSIPAKRKPPFSFSLSLAQKVVGDLKWAEKYPSETTLRQAIIDYMIVEFEKAKEPEVFRFFKLFIKLLDFDLHDEVLEDMSFFSMGSRIKLLFNEKALLDVPVQKLLGMSPDSDIQDLVINDQNPILKLFNVMGCFERLNAIQGKYIEKNTAQMKKNLDIAKELIVEQASSSRKSKVVRILYDKRKVRLDGEELVLDFFNKARGYQIHLNRFSSLKNELLEMSNGVGLRRDQKCLHLNNGSHRLKRFIEVSSKQNNCLMRSLKALKDTLNPDQPNEALNFFNCVEETLNQYSGIYYSFLNGMINYLHCQEVILTNSSAPPEELQDTSEWMGSVQKAEKKVSSAKSDPSITQPKKNNPRKFSTEEKPAPQSSSSTVTSAGAPIATTFKSDLKSLVEEAQSLENKACKKANKPKSRKSKQRTHGRKKNSAGTAKPAQNNTSAQNFNFDAFPLPKKGVKSPPVKDEKSSPSLQVSPRTAIFSEVAQDYCEAWNNEIRQIYQMNRGKVDNELFYQSSVAAYESDKHLLYSTVGFEQFCHAIKRNDWSALPQIVSMSILDLFIMNEQLLRTAYIGKFNKINYDDHDIVESAQSTGIYDWLSPESQGHLSDLNKATLWVRYPVNSLRYYRSRHSHTTFPKALLAIENSQLIASGKLQTRKQLKDYLTYMFGLFTQQCNTSYEIIASIRGETNQQLLLARDEYIKQIEQFHQQALFDLPIMIDDSKPTQTFNGAEFGKEILQLHGIADDIQDMINSLGVNTKLSSRSFLKEAHGHVKNLIETLHLYDVNKHPRQAAWIFRNCLKVQLVLESLYTCRHVFRTGYPVMNHDLGRHHEKMKDIAVMNPSAFSFNKSMQYTSSHACHENALPKIKSLQKLEDAMEKFENDMDAVEEQKNKEYFDVVFRKFVTDVLPLLALHVEACQNDLERSKGLK